MTAQGIIPGAFAPGTFFLVDKRFEISNLLNDILEVNKLLNILFDNI
jgi:hypothetical protein